MKQTLLALLGFLLVVVPATQAQFKFTTNNGAITITGYTGTNNVVTIPDKINGLPVTSIDVGAFQGSALTGITIPDSVTNIGDSAFVDCESLTNVTIGSGVTTIGDQAFGDCISLTTVTIPASVSLIWANNLGGGGAFDFCLNLTRVYFKGNAPSSGFGDGVFMGDTYATAYYLPGTTGWSATFARVPTALWLPQMQTGDAGFRSEEHTSELQSLRH